MGYYYSNPGEDFVPELYQEVAIQHLLMNRYAALFAGCGLGKTASCLAALNELFSEWQTIGALVVAPLRVANLTWKNEVRKWKQFQWMKVVNLRTPKGIEDFKAGRGHIYVINYEALPRFCDEVLHKMRGRYPFDTLIWDELSKAKSHDSVRVNALRRYWQFIDRHWGLTGTPQPNDELDLFAQFRALDNGERLGNNFHRFRARHFFSTDEYDRKWFIKKKSKLIIEEQIADITLVLKSEDYLDIPPVTVEDVEITLPKKARKRYKKLEKELFLKIRTSVVEALNSAVLVNKLLQVTAGSIYDTDKNIIELHDAKIEAAKKIYHETPTPVMFAIQYKHEESRLRAALPGAVCFSSATTHRAQDRLVRDWNDGIIPALIVHPASVGHGLNLQGGGHTIVWMSLGWSRELYDQLNARLARKGQRFATRIIRLLCKGTVDDAVAEALHEKGEGQRALMDTIENIRMLGRL